MRALTIYRPALPPMVCVRPVQTHLYQEFLAVCNRGDLVKIRQFHKEQIQTHTAFFPNPFDPKPLKPVLYSLFMGTVYCNLKEKNDPVARWFQAKAAEIHRLH